MAWFAEAARSRIAPDTRVFVVHAQPTERTQWPAALTDLDPYAFFARHPLTNLDLPLGFIGDKDDEVRYKAALYNLAGQIKQQIDELLAEAKTSLQPPLSSPVPLVVVPVQPTPRSSSLPLRRRLVCLETTGAVSAAGVLVEKDIRRLLEAHSVEIFTPASFGPATRDPILAEKLLQKLLKAKAGCDGLLLVRLDAKTSIGDWILDYLSEIRPMARRVRADSSPPAPLVIDAASSAAAGVPDGVPVVRHGQPGFEELLRTWVDGLPVAHQAAA